MQQKKNNIMIRSIAVFISIIFLSGLVSAKPNEITVIDNELFNAGPYDFVYGQPDAPVQILEYFSLTCPHCENFYSNVFSKLKEQYIDTGKVFWIKRSYITDAASMSGTMLLGCADKESRDAYLHILLVKQSSWAYQRNFLERLNSIAGLGGMSAIEFDSCMKNSKLEKDIRHVASEAKRVFKISGTPLFFMNQKRFDVYSYKSFAKQIDELLLVKKDKN